MSWSIIGTHLYKEEECLAPERELRLEWKGVQPLRICEVVRRALLEVLEIAPHWVWEREFSWDTTADPRTFFSRLYGRKAFDAVTYLLVEVVLDGKQPANLALPGSLVVCMSGKLVSDYRLDEWWKKPPFLSLFKACVKLKHAWFYDRVRGCFMQQSLELLRRIWECVRAELKV